MIKKIVPVFIALGLLLLTFFSYSDDSNYYYGPVPMERVLLSERNNGFKGARIQSILPNPRNTNQVIAKGPAGSYYSANNGDSWTLIGIDGYKYGGGKPYVPNVYWDTEGNMVAIQSNSFEWSLDKGKTWQGQWINYNVMTGGMDKKGNFWLRRSVGKQTQDVFEYIKRNPDNSLNIQPITNPNTIQQIQQEDAEILDQLPTHWKIENNVPLRKENGQWIVKSNGIKRPVILRFYQDPKQPQKIVAVEGTNIDYSQYSGVGTEIIFGYWYSKDFGLQWNRTDSSILKGFPQTIRQDSAKCSLTLRQSSPRLASQKIPYNISFLALPTDVGWLSPNKYYMLGEHGIQIGDVSSSCDIKTQTLWSWNYYHWENQNRYQMYDLKAQTRNSYIGQEPPNAVFLKEGNRLKFIFTYHYGGLWYGEVPLNHPLTLNRFLHFFFYYRLIMFFNLLFVVYLLRKNKRIRSLLSKLKSK
ncbi:hypothetical protein BKI52_16550 [marine bacterium AO1-C]|nr:hypothetical protein BKI52_16550 [marine bacterium AO1-C]